MPKTSSKAAAAESVTGSAAASAVERVDLLDALEVGEPGSAPLPAVFAGVEFAINRYYPAAVIWEWSDLQREDTSSWTDEQIRTGNRKILRIIIAADDHDMIDPLLDEIGKRSIPEARRIFAYLNNRAGLTDKWGNVLAL